MRCTICRHGETTPSASTVTLTRGSATLIVRHVPADVCSNCGEEYVPEEIAEKLLAAAEEMEKAGVQVSIQEFIAA